jgi:hypothetical protein
MGTTCAQDKSFLESIIESTVLEKAIEWIRMMSSGLISWKPGQNKIIMKENKRDIDIMTKDIYYIATPYSDPSYALRKQRFESVTKFASILVAGGLRVYSPITMTHPMVDHTTGNHLIDHQGWIDFDSAFMSVCSRLIVLCLPGWSASRGVQQEINLMQGLEGKPVIHVVPYNLDSYPKDRNQQFKVAAHNQDRQIRFEITRAINEGLHAAPHYPFGRRVPKVKADPQRTKKVDFLDILGDLFGSNPFDRLWDKQR